MPMSFITIFQGKRLVICDMYQYLGNVFPIVIINIEL